MNENRNDAKPLVCVSELDDFAHPVPQGLPLLRNLRVDDGHGGTSYFNSTSSKPSVGQQVQSSRGDHSQDPGYSVDVLKYLSRHLLEEDVDDKIWHSRTSADANAASRKLNFDPQVQSSRNDRPQNIDSCDDVLNYMRRFLLEDDVEEKGGNPGAANAVSNKMNSFGSNITPSVKKDFIDDDIKYMHHHRLKDNVGKKASWMRNPADEPRDMISEVGSCIKHEDIDFSDDVLKYINHILLEEGVEEKTCTFQESEALQATEKLLYEAMWGQYPNSTHSVYGDSSLHGSDDRQEGTSLSSQSYSQSSNSSGLGHASVDGNASSPASSFELVQVHSGRHTVVQLNEGTILSDGKLLVCLSDGEESPDRRAVESGIGTQEFSNASTGKRHPHADDVPGLQEGRSSKQFALHRESSIGDDVFDRVLVFRQEKEESAIREEINKAFNATMQEDQSKDIKGRKRGKKKREAKKNEADLSTLLTLCAQAVAAENTRSANDYLRQIRQHSTPAGDGMQRVAHYFADGLEARMAGAGTQIYNTLINMPISAADLLKAYHIYLAACPHRKTSNFFSNQTILNVAEKVGSLHIVDFGTLYGFQWPSFLHKLSLRPGGPPSVRFTAIDFPCPGFRPSQRIQETGRRLASYAKKFNIPFEFNGLAQNWEAITLDDIKMRKGEVLVVNCLYRLRYLLDESVVPDCPRDIVLNLIRKMNPALFVLGIRNGGHNLPFFLTRFREALFHYSSIFDALDAVISRDRHERMLLERVVFGREAMNVIACEGAERLERPETYKQWHVRLARAGLEVLPLNREIMATARNKVKLYHKDFVIDDDGYWLLQGWKGRISYALSSWRPAP